MIFRVFVVFLSLCLLGASCQTLPEDRLSSFSLAAGQATQLIGGCSHPISIGHEYCPIFRGGRLPSISLVFTNPTEYVVSDCDLNPFVSGSVPNAGVIDIDLSSLSDIANRRGFCFVKIDSLESYPDARDSSQKHVIGHAGWVIFEILEVGYQIIPNPEVRAFCYKVSRTTKGRTAVEKVSCN